MTLYLSVLFLKLDGTMCALNEDVPDSQKMVVQRDANK